MSRTIFSQAPHISVEYDSAHYIYANWKGYVDIHQVKDGAKRVLDAIIHYQCSHLLNDNRELFGSWTQAIRAIERDALPQLIRSWTIIPCVILMGHLQCLPNAMNSAFLLTAK